MIEPKCSGHYFSGFEVPARWHLKSGKVARWSQRVQLNCVFEGLKMAKKCGFQFFHQIETYKRYILQKNGSKLVIFGLCGPIYNLHPPPPPYRGLPPCARNSTKYELIHPYLLKVLQEYQYSGKAPEKRYQKAQLTIC